MKDKGIFKGIKELEGESGTFLIEGGKVFKKFPRYTIFVGYIYPKRSNKAIYQQCVDLVEDRAAAGVMNE